LSVGDFLAGLKAWFQGLPKDPAKWTFGGLKRQGDGSFRDADLVNLLQTGTDDISGMHASPPSNLADYGLWGLTIFGGAFGARNVPSFLRVVEILGIQQGRQWGLATLNELRSFFKLKPHSTFGKLPRRSFCG
jgi:hypothetical protein